MLREEIWPFFKRLLFKGARPDVQKELQQDGYYEMAQNMRPVSVDGTSGSLTSIGGEQIDWEPPADLAPFAGEYVCIGACIVNGIKVSFWAHRNGIIDPETYPPVIVADGVVIAKSPRIPYRYDRALDFGDVSKQRAGTVFPADGFNDPLFWDIRAMQEALSNGEDTYFGGFSVEFVSVLPSGPREWPEHIASPNVGVGLPVGMYRYWLRFVTPTGDRTNPGPPTPFISIPRVQAPVYAGDENGQYPGGQTVGGAVDPDNLTPTPYGIRLKFQVDNYLGYPILEIVRERHNTGQGLASAGIVEVVARISIAEGQLGYIEWTDPVDANFFETIAPDEAQQRIIAFTAPQTVEHVDNRLVYANFRLRDRTPRIGWREIEGRRMLPITNRVFTRYGGGTPDEFEYDDGYSDPVSNTYMKGGMHNERQSFGMMIWDSLAGVSFVAPIEDNYKHPDKKDRKGGASLALSWNMNAPFGIAEGQPGYSPPDPIYGTNNECQDLSAQGIPFDPVSPTFDCIVQGTRRKSNDSYTNVVNGLNYNPLRPVSPTDQNTVRYRQMPVQEWVVSPGVLQPVTGHMFAPQVHALGVAIAGPANIDAEAPYWEVMEVMATPEAGRVVAEGLACYVLRDAPAFSKFADKLNCFFPDINSGLVPASLINDIQSNPQNYKAKLVPRGFGAELYSKLGTSFSRGADIINYMDVQFDNGNSVQNPQWSVNTGEAPGTMGFQPTFSAPLEPTNYVGYGAFRSTPVQGVTDPANNQYSIFLDPNNTEQGNVLIGISGVENVDEGRGSFVRLTLSERPYRLDGQSSNGDQFNSAFTRRFNEPFYIIQIIREAATVPQQNVQDYFGTGYRVARERTIGLGRQTGEVYDLELFHARVEDAVPLPGSGDYRYVTVRQQGQQDKLFICLTNAAPEVLADLAAAQALWAAGQPWADPAGQQVWGTYTYVFSNAEGPRTVHYLRFGEYGSAPAPGARIIVKYSDSPIRAFGLGNTTAPAIFSPLDRVFDWETNTLGTSTQFFNPGPLPYRGGVLSSNYILPYDPAGGGSVAFEPPQFNNIVSIRQWSVMGHCVTRTPQYMNLGNDGVPYRGQFPERHYVMRPTRVVNTSPTGFAQANGLNPNYESDYPQEGPFLRMGGFWTSTNYNLDYSKAPVIYGKGVPRNSQPENLDYSNWHIASLKQLPGAIDTPGNRTFLSEGLFPISEENGPIMRIISVDQGGAQQLYGWTTRGVYRVMYNRDTLYGADGNTIGTQFVDSFWPRQEMWLSRGSRGMPDQLWRCATKVRTQGYETVCWVDRVSAYILADGRPSDIAVNKFLSVLQTPLKETPGDYEPGYNALFNPKQNEWWFTIKDRQGRKQLMFVYSLALQDWVGMFTYEYDQFLADDTNLYGFRRMSSNVLDVGETIIGPSGAEPFEKWAEVALAPHPFMVSELIKWRVGPEKPDEFRVYDKDHAQMLITNEQVQEAFDPGTGQLWVLNIDSWEQMMGNVDASYDPARSNPPQDVRFFLRAIQRSREKFVLTFIGAHAKQIP